MTGRVLSLAQFKQVVRDMPRDLRNAMSSGLRDAAQTLATEVRKQIRIVDAVDTEQLYDSVEVRPGLGGATVVVDAPHAVFVEKGTRPHMPPIAPLEAWGIRKLGREGLGWAIAKKIARDGTKPRRYFRTATQRAAPAMNARIVAALNRARTRGRVVNVAGLEQRLRNVLSRGG